MNSSIIRFVLGYVLKMEALCFILEKLYSLDWRYGSTGIPSCGYSVKWRFSY